jgi:radical SAM-linked protein
LWLAVQGDLRFLSHRDCARLIERAAVRAQLPLKYTQGFNPHPVLSLVPPRPVGVASRDDLLVAWLTQCLDAEAIVSALNRQMPRGMEFLHARKLEPGQSPVPRSIRHEWPIPADRLEAVQRQAELFAAAADWPIERSTPADGRDTAPRKRPLDLKALVRDLAVRDGVLCWAQTPAGDLWARPGEVLAALGQDSHVDLASVVRTAVDYGL